MKKTNLSMSSLNLKLSSNNISVLWSTLWTVSLPDDRGDIIMRTIRQVRAHASVATVGLPAAGRYLFFYVYDFSDFTEY